MADRTKIQWADSTVNPIMGCGGCELYKTPATICREIDEAIAKSNPNWNKGDSKRVFERLCREAYDRIPKELLHPSHTSKVTTANIYHLREKFYEEIEK